MNRRRFLSLFAGAAAASTTAYFLPPICGWKSDVIAHPDVLGWEDRQKLIALARRYKDQWAEHRLARVDTFWMCPPGFTVPLEYTRLGA